MIMDGRENLGVGAPAEGMQLLEDAVREARVAMPWMEMDAPEMLVAFEHQKVEKSASLINLRNCVLENMDNLR
jgi:hypothetical protein